MNMLNSTQKKVPSLYELGNHRVQKKTLIYIATVNILLVMILVCSIFLMMPKIVDAATADKIYNGYEMSIARRKMESYYHNTTDIFEKEEDPPYIEIEELLPKPVYHNFSYTSFGGWYSGGSAAAKAAWSHAFDLYNRGLIHGSTAGYWCTFFAQMWFYDVFGFNSSGNRPTGDGSQFAYTVYNTAVYYDEEGNLKHWFKLSDRPETMSIVSTMNSHDGSGHVLCVDEVDYLNNTITVSEGNVSYGGDVRIRHTMSLSTFYALNPGYKVYCVPTQELYDRLSAQASQ